MTFAKKFGLRLLSAFFTFCILALAVLAATNAVFGTPDALKKSLADSKAYDSAAAGLVDQASKTAQKPPEAQSPGDVQIDPAVVKDVATKVITPQKLQGYAEQVIDGTYHWLEGKTDTPDFNIDLTSIKQDLGNSVGDVAVQRIQGLPVCTVAQLRQMDASNVDPFTLPCHPPGIDLQAQRQKLINEVVNNGEVIQDNSITADDTKSEQTGETPFQRLGLVPTIFQWSKAGPWILGVLALATAAGIVFWEEDRRRGLKRISKSLLISGVLLLIGIWLASFAFSHINFNKEDPVQSAQLNQAMVDVVRTLNAAFNRALLVFAIVYAAMGAGGLIGLRFWKPGETASGPDVPEHPEQKTPEPKTDSGKSSKK